MGGNPITNEVARKALSKLEAVGAPEMNSAHNLYEVVYKGKVVATTGIRRSSKRDIPIPEFKRNLRVSAGFVLDLARCPKSRNDYLREIGVLLEEDK